MIMGPPGVGKTTLAIKLAKLWESLGLVNNKFKTMTRGDLVGKYQGWTSDKVLKIIDEYSGGVVFVDESYGLMNSNNDSFGSEALTEIVESMSNKKKNVTWIFAGYENSVRKSLMASNEGLERRFSNILIIKKPSPIEMTEILFRMIKRKKWNLLNVSRIDIEKAIQSNLDVLKFSGGDMERLCAFSLEQSINETWPKFSDRNIKKKHILSAINVLANQSKGSSSKLNRSILTSMYI